MYNEKDLIALIKHYRREVELNNALEYMPEGFIVRSFITANKNLNSWQKEFDKSIENRSYPDINDYIHKP